MKNVILARRHDVTVYTIGRQGNVKPVNNMADINRCTERYLTGVLGLDQMIASRIIRYKRKVGTLKHIDELLRVKGVTRHIFDLISSNLQVKDQKETAIGETLPYEVTGSTLLSSNNSQENDIDKGNGMRNSFLVKNKYNLRREGVTPFKASATKRTTTSKSRQTKKKETYRHTSKRRRGRDYRKRTQPTTSTDIQKTNVKKDNVFMLTPMSIEVSLSGEMLTIMYKSPAKMFRGRKHGDSDEREHSKTTVSTDVIEKHNVALNESHSDFMNLSKVATGKTSYKRRRSGAFPSGKGKGYKKRRLDGKNKEQQSEAQDISKEPSLLNKVIPIESKHQSVEKWLSALPVEIECAKVNADGEAFLGGLGKKINKMSDQSKKILDEQQPGPSGIGNDKNGNKSMEYSLKSQEFMAVVASTKVMGENECLVPVANNELYECSKQILFESIGLIEKKESKLAQDLNIKNKISENEMPDERKLSKLQDGGKPDTPIIENFNGNNDPSNKLKDTDRIERKKSEKNVKEMEHKGDERSGDKKREGREKNTEQKPDRNDVSDHNKDRGQNVKERKEDRKDHGKERREDKREEKEHKSGLKKDDKEKKDEKRSDKKIEDKMDDQNKQREKKSSSKEKVEDTKKSGGGWFCILL
ncbi:hypothetical protein CHS0354_029107 [Potamilus streckersoni]|uniref:Uncharacterized protein n=1 Tax=Potamilus streckersoni TaxID=2493646 RepID=A0AAE0SWR9_9BIVA|nr:hypothetical protein CHS0354_029107 [Potamilus streckersoni]